MGTIHICWILEIREWSCINKKKQNNRQNRVCFMWILKRINSQRKKNRKKSIVKFFLIIVDWEKIFKYNRATTATATVENCSEYQINCECSILFCVWHYVVIIIHEILYNFFLCAPRSFVVDLKWSPRKVFTYCKVRKFMPTYCVCVYE